jgi:hypothetical protein
MRKALDGHREDTDPGIAYASHPPLALRARALFWFEEYRVKHFPRTDLEAVAAFRKLDERVARDMEKYVDTRVVRLRMDAALELKRWIWTGSAISKERFDAKSQAIIAQEFGQTPCDKVKGMLTTLSDQAAFEWVSGNAASAYLAFSSMFPLHACNEAKTALNKSEHALLGPEAKCFLRARDWAKNF